MSCRIRPLARSVRLGVVVLAVACASCGGGAEPPAAPVGEPPEATPVDARHERGLVTGVAPPATSAGAAVVLLEPHAEIDVPLPAESPIMDQYGRQFLPGFLLARAGQTIRFTNSEDDLHTVHVKDSHGESLFNVATMMGSVYDYTFDLGDAYSVVCNTHTEMFADILVVDTPYAVIADPDGAFAMDDVLPGTYTASVIQGGERRDRDVEIVAGPNELDLS